jgi:hypothetical protein
LFFFNIMSISPPYLVHVSFVPCSYLLHIQIILFIWTEWWFSLTL